MTVTGYVRRVDDYNRKIIFTDGPTVKNDDVWNIRIIGSTPKSLKLENRDKKVYSNNGDEYVDNSRRI